MTVELLNLKKNGIQWAPRCSVLHARKWGSKCFKRFKIFFLARTAVKFALIWTWQKCLQGLEMLWSWYFIFQNIYGHILHKIIIFVSLLPGSLLLEKVASITMINLTFVSDGTRSRSIFVFNVFVFDRDVIYVDVQIWRHRVLTIDLLPVNHLMRYFFTIYKKKKQRLLGIFGFIFDTNLKN